MWSPGVVGVWRYAAANPSPGRDKPCPYADGLTARKQQKGGSGVGRRFAGRTHSIRYYATDSA